MKTSKPLASALNVLTCCLISIPAFSDEAEDMAEMQRQLNAEVMAKSFSVEDAAKIDAYVEEAMKKDLKPKKLPPQYWQSGYTCESIRSRSWQDYRDCRYYRRYHGRYW